MTTGWPLYWLYRVLLNVLAVCAMIVAVAALRRPALRMASLFLGGFTSASFGLLFLALNQANGGWLPLGLGVLFLALGWVCVDRSHYLGGAPSG